MIFIDPDGKELKIYILNSSSYSDNVARQVGEKAASRFREAGVKNVTVEVAHRVPKDVGKANVAVTELLARGSRQDHVSGELGSLRPHVAGRNYGDGQSGVDVNYYDKDKPGQNVSDVVKNIGSNMQHEIAHSYLEHSSDPNSPMVEGEHVVDKPFTTAEQKVLQEKLNKPNEVENKPNGGKKKSS